MNELNNNEELQRMERMREQLKRAHETTVRAAAKEEKLAKKVEELENLIIVGIVREAQVEPKDLLAFMSGKKAEQQEEEQTVQEEEYEEL